MTCAFLCPRCKVDQLVGANVVSVYSSVDGLRILVRCPDCTTAVDTPCDPDTAAAVCRMAAGTELVAGMLRLELDVAGAAAASMIGRTDG